MDSTNGALAVNFLATDTLVTLQAGLHPLAVANDSLSLRPIREVPIVNILVIVAPHAALAVLRRLADI